MGSHEISNGISLPKGGRVDAGHGKSNSHHQAVGSSGRPYRDPACGRQVLKFAPTRHTPHASRLTIHAAPSHLLNLHALLTES
jgi:hypothetical protein